MNIIEAANLIASFATAAGVIFAACQLWQSRSQGVTTFEDSFDKEYRDLSRCILTRALLGENISEEEKNNPGAIRGKGISVNTTVGDCDGPKKNPSPYDSIILGLTCYGCDSSNYLKI